MWIARPEYQPGQIVLKLTCPFTGLGADSGVDAGDLVAAQEVLAARVAVVRAAACLLAGLVGVEPVGVRVPDVDMRAVDRAAVRGVEDVDPERQRHARLRRAGVAGRARGVGADVEAAEHLVHPVGPLGHARRDGDRARLLLGRRHRRRGRDERLERAQAAGGQECGARRAERLSACDLLRHLAPFVVAAMIRPPPGNELRAA